MEGCQNLAIECYTGDFCSSFSCDNTFGCVYTSRVCDDYDLCTSDSTNSQSSQCEYDQIQCNDNNTCMNQLAIVILVLDVKLKIFIVTIMMLVQ